MIRSTLLPGALAVLVLLSGPVWAQSQSADHRLFEAILYESIDEVKAAINTGASLNARGNDDWTPVMAAVRRNDVGMLKLLLDAGADPKAVTNTGMNAMRYTGLYGCAECIPVLKSAGLDPSEPDRDGWSALSYAGMSGRPDIVQALVAAGADLNHKTATGDTPLHLAAASADEKTVRALLEVGADPTLTNDNGFTPMDTAAFQEDKEAWMLLKQHMDGQGG